MALDYELIRNWRFPEVSQRYGAKDCMLYALGVGFGLDPLDEGQLRYVYESDLQVVPTMSCVLGHPGAWFMDPKARLDWVRIVHGEQDLSIFKPLPPSGDVFTRTRVTSIVDKGSDKGALIRIQRDLHLAGTGELIASQYQGCFARGDGGFGHGDPSLPPLPTTPPEPPDIVCDLPTAAHQALIYRITADLNPLHADPHIAQAAGFPKPILHGLAVYGVACHAILRTCCDYDPRRVRRFGLRFYSPVFPGETIRTTIWKRGRNAYFRAFVLERNALVLTNGIAELD